MMKGNEICYYTQVYCITGEPIVIYVDVFVNSLRDIKELTMVESCCTVLYKSWM